MYQRSEFRMLALALMTSACAPMGAAWSPEQSPKEIAVNVSAESYVVKLDERAKALPKGEHESSSSFLPSRRFVGG